MFLGVCVQARHTDPPKKEFLFQAAATSVEIGRGSSGKIDLQILRSKHYQKSEAALSIASTIPRGITVQYDQDSGLIDKSAVTINVSDQAAPGEYSVLLNCTLNYKTKGVILKLKVI